MEYSAPIVFFQRPADETDQSWTKSGAESERLKAASQAFSSVPPRKRALGAAFRDSRKRWCQRLICRILSTCARAPG